MCIGCVLDVYWMCCMWLYELYVSYICVVCVVCVVCVLKNPRFVLFGRSKNDKEKFNYFAMLDGFSFAVFSLLFTNCDLKIIERVTNIELRHMYENTRISTVILSTAVE